MAWMKISKGDKLKCLKALVEVIRGNLLGNASRIDEHIRNTVSFDNSGNSLCDCVLVANIDPVEGDRDRFASQLVQLSNRLVTQLLVRVQDNNSLCTGFDT